MLQLYSDFGTRLFLDYDLAEPCHCVEGDRGYCPEQSMSRIVWIEFALDLLEVFCGDQLASYRFGVHVIHLCFWSSL